MLGQALPSGRNAAALALEANADRARLALACAYSSSEEYEADVIRARRQAGVYGPRRHQRQAIVALVLAFSLIVTVSLALAV
jgi:hypothetical protein